MRSKSLMTTFCLGPAALALIPGQFPINAAGKETSVPCLEITNSNADNAPEFPYHHGSLSANAEQWNLDEGPPENATGNLVFDTVHSFMQHWPNTRYRNGHNIVPGVIPIGTLLYHGTILDTIPTGPNWMAMDPEHSIIFCRAMEGGGWHLTLAATRPLKVLYFDGSSAAKIPEGTMDTQDIIAWGEPRTDRLWDELDRIRDLCAWGKEFGIDGFVRMEWNFEVLLCDFTDGVRVVSFLNIATPETHVYPGPDGAPPDSDIWIRFFEAMHSGSWHNHYPGDSRIVLDLAGLVSLYDTTLVPTLIPVRAGLERCDHRVLGISSEDISRVMRKLTEIFSRPGPVGSGIDWTTLMHVIVDRYADRLELIQHLLNFTSSDSQKLLQRAKLAQAQLRIMLTPYLLHSTVVPNASTSGVNSLQWTYPMFRRCATTHTSEMIAQVPLMTSSEHLLLNAVQETTKEICRVTTKMWATGVMNGLDTLFQVERNRELETTRLIDGWRDDIQKLMSWLDWSVWIKCQPVCGPEEICYLPTWPISAPTDRAPPWSPEDPGNPAAKSADAIPRLAIAFPFPEAPEDWRKPRPKCIRRFQPYEY